MSEEKSSEGRAAAHQPSDGKTYLTVRHAAFIGFGAMIGAGISRC
jgi:hypothetical protein